MIRKLTFVFVFAICTNYFIELCADPVSIPLKPVDDEGENKTPDRGHRSQSIRVTCSIDYDANEVTLTPAREEEILTYEIWDADGCVCLGIYFYASSFLGHLSQLSKATIVLHTESKSYSGYYSN